MLFKRNHKYYILNSIFGKYLYAKKRGEKFAPQVYALFYKIIDSLRFQFATSRLFK